MIDGISVFEWRGQSSSFTQDKHFTWLANTLASDAKKRCKAISAIPSLASINTEIEDRVKRPFKKGRAL